MAKEKIVAKVIFQMMGSPKEHIEQTISDYVDKIEELYPKLKLLKKEIEEGSKQDEESDLFTVVADIELESEGIDEISWFCIDYMPASIEIVEPAVINYPANDMSGYLNDLLGKLHTVGMELKRANAERETLGKNSVVLMKNMIMIQLTQGPKTLAELSKGAGVPEDHIMKFTKNMVEAGKIVEKDGKLALPN